MASTRPPDQPVRSSFASDADMAGAIAYYVDSLPAFTSALADLWRKQRFEELQTQARQLSRDSAGCGYDGIAEAAERLQQSLWAMNHGAGKDEQALEDLRRQFRELIDLCGRVGR